MMKRLFLFFLLFVFTGILPCSGSGLDLFTAESSMALIIDADSLSNDVALSKTVSGKSKGKAFLMSLIIPGLGQRYAESDKSRLFMVAEVGLWLTYTGLITYRDWKREDYRIYAATHANVVLQGKSDSYFIDVGNYNSIDDYNAAKLRQRNLPDYYHNTGKYYWKWASEAHRQKFDEMRVTSDQADNRALFALGAIFANHIFSAIHSIWSVKGYNQAQEEQVRLNMHYTPERSVMFSLQKSF
ncbi:hypothetical protein GF407_15325 [candidate division KSB1 bacterium]|nr:hypothetical protein [candidate division KSB1 bacterium]